MGAAVGVAGLGATTFGAGAGAVGLGAAALGAGGAADVDVVTFGAVDLARLPEGLTAERGAAERAEDVAAETFPADASCSSFAAAWRALAPTGTAQFCVSVAVPALR